LIEGSRTDFDRDPAAAERTWERYIAKTAIYLTPLIFHVSLRENILMYVVNIYCVNMIRKKAQKSNSRGLFMKKTTGYLTALTLMVAMGCGVLSGDNVSVANDSSSAEAVPDSSPSDEVYTKRLFHIERSKNANIVCYDARLMPDGEFDPERPVEVYWILKAEDGRRAELNWIQKRKAYGFEIERAPSGDGYEMIIVPMPDRKITVKKVDGKVRAETRINGKAAVLEKVYIESTTGWTGPKVHYVKLFGRGLEKGEDLVEKIVPE
jgi:hypothetical protein